MFYTETRVWKLDHARVGLWGNSHMGKGLRAEASLYFGHMSSFHLLNRLLINHLYATLCSGTEPCATGGQCIPESDKCDGRHDCEDHSDERDCRKCYHCSLCFGKLKFQNPYKPVLITVQISTGILFNSISVPMSNPFPAE